MIFPSVVDAGQFAVVHDPAGHAFATAEMQRSGLDATTGTPAGNELGARFVEQTNRCMLSRQEAQEGIGDGGQSALERSFLRENAREIEKHRQRFTGLDHGCRLMPID